MATGVPAISGRSAGCGLLELANRDTGQRPYHTRITTQAPASRIRTIKRDITHGQAAVEAPAGCAEEHLLTPCTRAGTGPLGSRRSRSSSRMARAPRIPPGTCSRLSGLTSPTRMETGSTSRGSTSSCRTLWSRTRVGLRDVPDMLHVLTSIVRRDAVAKDCQTPSPDPWHKVAAACPGASRTSRRDPARPLRSGPRHASGSRQERGGTSRIGHAAPRPRHGVPAGILDATAARCPRVQGRCRRGLPVPVAHDDTQVPRLRRQRGHCEVLMDGM